MKKPDPRPGRMIRLSDEELAIADASAERIGVRTRSEYIRSLISLQAKKLRIKRTSPEVIALLATGTEGATDGE